MEKFRQFIKFINKLGNIFWFVGLFFKIVGFIYDECEKKFGNKNDAKLKVINPYKIDEDENGEQQKE